jgi:orotate phosphoribosyltransferase
LAVEDTSTTGGSVLTAVEALKEAGAIVVGVAVIVERGANKQLLMLVMNTAQRFNSLI